MIPRNTPQEKIAAGSDVPVIQYANGRMEGRINGGRFAPHVGFLLETGKWEEIDRAMQESGAATIEIRHARDNGPAVIARHWALGERIIIFPITAGPPATSIGVCSRFRASTADSGIGIDWPQGGRSRLAIRAILMIGASPWLVQFGAKSTSTDDLLGALLRHVQVCEIADSIVDRKRHPEPVGCYEIGMPLVASKEERSAGNAQTTIITPLISGHPLEDTKITVEHIRGLFRPVAAGEMAVNEWPATVEWAHAFGIVQEGQPA